MIVIFEDALIVNIRANTAIIFSHIWPQNRSEFGQQAISSAQ